jgi:hypothetical protein
MAWKRCGRARWLFSVMAFCVLTPNVGRTWATESDTLCVSTFPDTFMFRMGDYLDRLPMKVLSYDTALVYRYLVFLGGPEDDGRGDFLLTKLPAESTFGLVQSSRYRYCSGGLVCFSYGVRYVGIQYQLKTPGQTYYLKPETVYIDTQNAVPDSIQMIIDSTLFLANTWIVRQSGPQTRQPGREVHTGSAVDVQGRKLPNDAGASAVRIVPGSKPSRSVTLDKGRGPNQ